MVPVDYVRLCVKLNELHKFTVENEHIVDLQTMLLCKIASLNNMLPRHIDYSALVHC